MTLDLIDVSMLSVNCFRCPVCGAGEEVNCVNSDGEVMQYAHVSRLNLFRKYNREAELTITATAFFGELR